MANNIEYTNNSVQVTAALKNAVKKRLYEAGGELQARIIRNSRTRTGQTKGSYQYSVDEENGVCTVGSAWKMQFGKSSAQANMQLTKTAGKTVGGLKSEMVVVRFLYLL